MKELGIRLFFVLCSFVCIAILYAAILYPFALSFEDGPPWWTIFIVYPLAFLVMRYQHVFIHWAEGVLEQFETED